MNAKAKPLVSYLKAFYVAEKTLAAYTHKFGCVSDIEVRAGEGFHDDLAQNRVSNFPEIVTSESDRRDFILLMDGLINGREEGAVGEGFLNNVTGPRFQEISLVHISNSRANNDGNVGKTTLDQKQEVLPVQCRHAHIERHAIRGMLFYRRQSLMAIRAGLDFVAALAKKALGFFKKAGIVVNNQDFTLMRFHGIKFNTSVRFCNSSSGGETSEVLYE